MSIANVYFSTFNKITRGTCGLEIGGRQVFIRVLRLSRFAIIPPIHTNSLI